MPFGCNSKRRILVTPAKRGKGKQQRVTAANTWLEKTAEDRHRAMTWIQRLKRIFNIDTETCERCGRQEKDALIYSQPDQRRMLQRRIERLRTFRENRTQVPARDIAQYREVQEKKRDVADFKDRMQNRKIREGPELGW